MKHRVRELFLAVGGSLCLSSHGLSPDVPPWMPRRQHAGGMCQVCRDVPVARLHIGRCILNHQTVCAVASLAEETHRWHVPISLWPACPILCAGTRGCCVRAVYDCSVPAFPAGGKRKPPPTVVDGGLGVVVCRAGRGQTRCAMSSSRSPGSISMTGSSIMV